MKNSIEYKIKNIYQRIQNQLLQVIDIDIKEIKHKYKTSAK